jgi:hypothetical protein
MCDGEDGAGHSDSQGGAQVLLVHGVHAPCHLFSPSRRRGGGTDLADVGALGWIVTRVCAMTFVGVARLIYQTLLAGMSAGQ